MQPLLVYVTKNFVVVFIVAVGFCAVLSSNLFEGFQTYIPMPEPLPNKVAEIVLFVQNILLLPASTVTILEITGVFILSLQPLISVTTNLTVKVFSVEYM